MSGDFILTAQFRFVGDGAEAHRKVGWMVHKTLDANSPYADAVVHGDGLTSLQFRRNFDVDTEEVKNPVTAPDVLQLEKSGDDFIMRAAKFGEPLQETKVVHVALGDSVFVGLVICLHNEKNFEQAVVSNVRIEISAPQDFVPYQDYGASRLELLDVATGRRKIIYESPDPLEAPNCKALIYNSKGLLYNFDLKAGAFIAPAFSVWLARLRLISKQTDYAEGEFIAHHIVENHPVRRCGIRGQHVFTRAGSKFRINNSTKYTCRCRRPAHPALAHNRSIK